MLTPEQKRDWYLRHNHRITLIEFNHRLAEQDGRCANPGCRTNTPKHGWHLDHDHLTGQIRGILCSECNRLLGCAEDSVAILLGAANYVAKWDRDRVKSA